MRGSVRCLFTDFPRTMIRNSSESEVMRMHAASDGSVAQDCRQGKGLAKGRTKERASDCETNPISPSEPTFVRVAFPELDDTPNPILSPEFHVTSPTAEAVNDETNPILSLESDAIPMSSRSEVITYARVKLSGQVRCKLRWVANAVRF